MASTPAQDACDDEICPSCGKPLDVCTRETRAHDEIEDERAEQQRDLIAIIVSAVLFVIGLVLEQFALPVFIAPSIFLVAYLVAGVPVLVQAARNIGHGQVFDENFLMSIATFGAIGVQQYPEAVGVMLFYRIGELFEDRAVERSRSQIMDAVDMRPETVNRLVDYEVETVVRAEGCAVVEEALLRRTETVDAAAAQVGDYVLVKPGERIPLDGTIVEGTSRLDTSPVTGEPVPALVQAGSAVLSGCVNENGLLVMRVDKVLAESMVTRILDSVENASANKPQIQRFITRFAKIYTPIVIGIAVATALIPSLATGNWGYWVYTACTFLVISCPCAIVLSVPLAFFAGIGAASKLGILFKGGKAIEALKGVKALVMDKTGTITEGVFAVQSVDTASGLDAAEVLAAAAAAELGSTHPIATSIVAAAQGRGLPLAACISVTETAGKGVAAHVAQSDGQSCQVLCGTRALLEEHGIVVPETFDETVVRTCVYVALDGTFAGTIAISDALKSDSAQAITDLHVAGMHTVMLTGDEAGAAQAMAKDAGIDEVHARLLPEGKLAALADVRERYGAVMFVGDGINDAPVLAGADVGAAMGSGSDAALEAADVVFMTSSLGAVNQSLHIAHVVGAIAMQNIVFALVIKIGVMVLGLAGFASMWAAVFADVGVAMLCILNSVRILRMRF